jgi:CHAT domain-containing protein
MYNENLLKLAEYWNAQVMFENDRGDVKGYFTRAKKAHYLADEPELKWVEHLKGKTNRQKGMNMTIKRKEQGAIYLRDWLITPRGKDVWGNEKLNLHYIYDAALLQELIRWNLKGNFDRVSSLLIGMYDMKECHDMKVRKPKDPTKESFFKRQMYTNK